MCLRRGSRRWWRRSNRRSRRRFRRGSRTRLSMTLGTRAGEYAPNDVEQKSARVVWLEMSKSKCMLRLGMLNGV